MVRCTGSVAAARTSCSRGLTAPLACKRALITADSPAMLPASQKAQSHSHSAVHSPTAGQSSGLMTFVMAGCSRVGGGGQTASLA